MATIKEKPIIRVVVWNADNYPQIFAQKDFRTFKAAENFARKWGMKEDVNADPELMWNSEANKLLNEKL